MVFETIKNIIAEQLSLSDPSKITMETSLIKDLEADSLDAVELVVFIQRTYNIPQKAFEKRKELFVNFKTLADFVRTFPEDQKGR